MNVLTLNVGDVISTPDPRGEGRIASVVTGVRPLLNAAIIKEDSQEGMLLAFPGTIGEHQDVQLMPAERMSVPEVAAHLAQTFRMGLDSVESERILEELSQQQAEGPLEYPAAS